MTLYRSPILHESVEQIEKEFYREQLKRSGKLHTASVREQADASANDFLSIWGRSTVHSNDYFVDTQQIVAKFFEASDVRVTSCERVYVVCGVWCAVCLLDLTEIYRLS